MCSQAQNNKTKQTKNMQKQMKGTQIKIRDKKRDKQAL